MHLREEIDMHQRRNLLTVNEFYELTGLNSLARLMFDQFGFIHPQIIQNGAYYRPEDVLLFKTMETFIQEKNDLRTAYSKALAAMQALAA